MKKYTLLFLCFVVIQSYAQTTRYVKANATGANNGNSWANAYTNFQTAVNASSAGDEVWVAAGTYQPASGQFFAMKEGVKIYGGFVGNEGTLSARNWTGNVTTLQGNGSYVIKNELNGLTNAAVLDGFTVTGGAGVVAGAGMYNASSSPSVINCTFLANTATYGAGAIYNYQCSTPPVITNCIFSNNNGATYGGAIYNVLSSPVIKSCTFNNNTAVTGGGIYYNTQSVPNISNCTFKNNTASTAAGGAIYYNGSGISSNAYISNCLFAGNTSNAGSAIGYGDQVANNLIVTNCTFYNNTGSAALYARFWNAGFRPIILNNSIVYGNTAFFDKTASGGEIQVNYSLVQGASCPVGGTCNTGVIYNQDPKFMDAAAGNFALKISSPAVNKGNNSLNSVSIDIAGQPRLSGNSVDLGAYEFQSAAIAPDGNNIVYVDVNIQTGDGSGTSWTNAIPQLADALKWARQQNNFTTASPLKIYVAKGTYKPLYSAVDGSNYANGGRDNAFVMVKNVQLYGGFDPSSGNTNLNTRVLPTAANEFPTNGTVLSGDVNDNDVVSGSGNTLSITNNTENNYHVLVSIGDVETARLDGFTVKGGSANNSSGQTTINTVTTDQASGGGMYNQESSPTLANCAFTQNLANFNGGGIYSRSSNSTITNCVMSKNIGYYFGGGIYNLLSSVTLTNCTIKLNLQNSGSGGGGMANYSSTLILNDCSISDNSAVNGAGMINSGSTLTFNNCTINANKVTGNSGGALYNSTSTVRLFNCTINGNSVTNSANASGGAISNSSCPLVQITNCTISGNIVNGTNTRGSGVYITSSTTVLLVNSAIVGNSTPNDATGVGLYNISTSPKLMNATLANNGVGGVYSDANSTPEFQNSIVWGTVSGNYNANYSLVKGSSVTSNGNIDASSLTSTNIFTDDGNGIYTLKNGSPAVGTGSNSLYEAFDGDVNNNSLSSDKDLAGNDRLQKGTIDLGAFESSYNLVVPITPDANGIIYVKQNGAGNFSGNSWTNAAPELSEVLTAATTNTNIQQIWVAKGTYQPASGQSFAMKEGVKMYGGFAGTETQINQRVFGSMAADSTLLQGNGSYVVSSINLSAASVIDGFSIKGGSGQTWGGGMYNYGSSVTINNCLFAANSATIGGGICNYYNSAPTISNCTFSGNTADGGGGISNYNNSSPTISNCTFFRNRANSGGAINNYSSSKPNITGCTFTENTANDFGGAITNSTSSSSTITNCNFSGNKATSASGGAIFNTASSPIITDCSFSNNTSSTYGGGIFNEQSSAANISNSTFTSNASGGGGGIFNTGSSPSIIGCAFTSNSASVSGGGGVFNYSSSSAIISNCTFVSNTVSASGGGGMMNQGASPTVTNCVFKGNTSTGNSSGAGMYNVIAAATTVKNCVFYGNTSVRYAGAIYNGASSPKLINCTIAGNKAGFTNWGGGIYNSSSSSPVISNAIIYGNSDGIINSNSTPTVAYSIVQGGYVGTGNTDVDPLFTNAPAFSTAPFIVGDYTLQSFSPAANTGSNALYTGLDATTLDVAGNARVYRYATGGVIDRGAYEYQSFDVLPDANHVVYVNAAATGTGAGNSWANAVTSLADVLQWARTKYNADATVFDATPLKIYVAKGTYKPTYHAADANFTADGGRDNAFMLVKNVELYGGFAGTESSLSERNLKLVANRTILSGDLNGNDETTLTITANADNTHHVVLGVGNIGSAILDGFSIINGHANTASTIVVNGQTIYQDRGAGIYNQGASPKITNCIISGHTATADHTGAGIYNYSAAPVITNTLITGNKTSGNASAAAMYSAYSAPKLLNATVAGNNGTGTANAAIYHNLSSPVIGNAVVYGNSGGIIENTTVEAPDYQNPMVAINDNSTGTDPWDNPGNALTDNNSYATMSNAAMLISGTIRNSNFLAVKGLGFNIPPNAEILGVEVEIRKFSSDNTGGNFTRDLDFRLLKNNQVTGTNHANTGVNWPTTETAFTYGTNTDLWGLTLTPADVNANDFGVAIAVTSRASGLLLPTVISYIDQVRIKVSYQIDAVTSVSYSVIQGGFTGTGNLDVDPKYANPTAFAIAPVSAGNYVLHDESPAIGVGNNLLYTSNGGNLTDKDLLGNKRLSGTTIDMGAYEYQELVPDNNNILYVDAAATGTDEGSSWANASPSLADALKWARKMYHLNPTVFDATPLKIYVAKGTHKPAYNAANANYVLDGGRDNAFVLVKNVLLYGGFDPSNGIDDLTKVRIYGAGGTILSGDVNGDDVVTGSGTSLSITNNTDNNHHVVLAAGDLGNAKLDGFTIKGGNANGNNTITVNGVSASRANGGGMYNHTASPMVENCSFTVNAGTQGAGVMNEQASPTIINSKIYANSGGIGGGMYNYSGANVNVKGSIMYENKASSGGGGIVIHDSDGTFANTTFVNNGNMAFAVVSSGAPVLQNSIVWDNISGAGYIASYSLLKGSSDNTNGNINAGSLTGADIFNDEVNADYTLKSTSPAINKGNNNLYTSLSAGTKDLAGNLRVFNYATNGAIDMGAYEYQGVLVTTLADFANITKTFGDADFTLAAPTTNSDGAFTYTSSDENVATISGSTITIVGTGTTTITAAQAATGNYAAGSISLILTVNKTDQTISFAALANKIYGDADFSLSATGGASGNAVTYTSSNPLVATITGNTVTIVGTGSTTITASQLGNANYNAATNVQQTLTVDKAGQTISFAALANKTYGDAAFNLSATGGASGNAVTYTSSNPLVATIVGNTVTIVGAGNTTITASQLGNTNYNAATSVQQTLTVDKASQTISFAALANKTYGDAAFNLSATGGASGNAVIYTSSNPLVATITGNTVTIVGAGSTTITASQLGNANYNAATSVQQTLTVDKAGQAISFAALANKTYGDAAFNLSATGGASGNAVTYTSSNPLVATISGNTVTIVGVGSTTITASQLGNANYNAATNVQQTLTVDKAGQAISFAALANKTYGDADFNLSATGGASGNAVTYTSSNPLVATVSGNTVTIVGVGSTTITASQLGNANYNAATNVQQTLTVDKADQTISFAALANKTYGDAAFNLSVTGGASGNAITYTSSNPLVATITGNTVTIVGAGSTTITASQLGNANYNAATSVQQTLTVDKASQTISFAALTAKLTTSPDFVVVANSSSGLSLSFSSSDTNVAEVYQSAGVWMVKIKGAGTADITASQLGNGNYFAATSQVQSLLVAEPPLPVNLISYKATVEGNAAKLEWKTASEQNNKNFVVYRSGDDKAFAKLGEVNGHGTSSVANSYVFYDRQPLKGNNYYRLVQVDLNGKPAELGERVLNFELSAQGIQLYPNPTKGEAMLSFAAGKYTKLTVSSVEGKVLNIIALKPQDDKTQIDLAQYPVGVYFVRLVGGSESVTKKVIKQ
ncbi:choice-of-anchor Q domain-containing protein [Pedobacter sp.]|uniref:right-handed parallel beta-helix repeat-containing protein n=1 Tax=Pedobacter sp. TaxID=1411316 RepID=UPI0031D85F90